MSLDSGPGPRYFCLGVLLLLGALAVTSPARAQSPSLPYDPAEIQRKVLKSAELQRQALQSLTDMPRAEGLVKSAWSELRAAQHEMILNASRAKFVDPLFEMNNRRAEQALGHLQRASDFLATQKGAVAVRTDQEEGQRAGPSLDGVRQHIEQAVRLTNGLAF
jgi:hypothetical protein